MRNRALAAYLSMGLIQHMAFLTHQVNAVNNEGLTPLLAVCKYRGHNLALIRTLLALGCDANSRDQDSNSALHIAIKAGFEVAAIARVLMRYSDQT